MLITELMGASKAVRMRKKLSHTAHAALPVYIKQVILVFRHHLTKLNWYVDLGVMHQYWRQQADHFGSTLLFGADVIIKNPLGTLQHL